MGCNLIICAALGTDEQKRIAEIKSETDEQLRMVKVKRETDK